MPVKYEFLTIGNQFIVRKTSVEVCHLLLETGNLNFWAKGFSWGLKFKVRFEVDIRRLYLTLKFAVKVWVSN